jgi:ribosome-binding factor A
MANFAVKGFDSLDGRMKFQAKSCRAGNFLIFSFVSEVSSLEKRGLKYHRERKGEALREEIEIILEGELADPRIGLVHVSEVQMAPDGRSAHVFVVVEGDDDEAEQTMEGLAGAVGFIRRELVERLRLRRAPELVFQLDRSPQYQARIDELLNRTRKKQRQKN